MLEYQSVRRWSEIAWEKCGVVQSSAEMIGGGIGGNMVHDSIVGITFLLICGKWGILRTWVTIRNIQATNIIDTTSNIEPLT